MLLGLGSQWACVFMGDSWLRSYLDYSKLTPINENTRTRANFMHVKQMASSEGCAANPTTWETRCLDYPLHYLWCSARKYSFADASTLFLQCHPSQPARCWRLCARKQEEHKHAGWVYYLPTFNFHFQLLEFRNKRPKLPKHVHTHTHTYMYIYIYI